VDLQDTHAAMSANTATGLNRQYVSTDHFGNVLKYSSDGCNFGHSSKQLPTVVPLWIMGAHSFLNLEVLKCFTPK